MSPKVRSLRAAQHNESNTAGLWFWVINIQGGQTDQSDKDSLFVVGLVKVMFCKCFTKNSH